MFMSKKSIYFILIDLKPKSNSNSSRVFMVGSFGKQKNFSSRWVPNTDLQGFSREDPFGITTQTNQPIKGTEDIYHNDKNFLHLSDEYFPKYLCQIILYRHTIFCFTYKMNIFLNISVKLYYIVIPYFAIARRGYVTGVFFGLVQLKRIKLGVDINIRQCLQTDSHIMSDLTGSLERTIATMSSPFIQCYFACTSICSQLHPFQSSLSSCIKSP